MVLVFFLLLFACMFVAICFGLCSWRVARHGRTRIPRAFSDGLYRAFPKTKKQITAGCFKTTSFLDHGFWILQVKRVHGALSLLFEWWHLGVSQIWDVCVLTVVTFLT